MPWIEPEQLAIAKTIDLYSYLTIAEPDNIKRCGQDEYQLRDHDSLKVSVNTGKWHWHSRGFGGTTALQYLITVRGLPLPKAATLILDCKAAPYLPPVMPIPPRLFALPPRAPNDDRAIAYLCGARGIHRAIVEHCRAAGTLYESAKYHSCVFVGCDEQGKPRHAALRATGGDFKHDIEGSDKRYSFALYAPTGACTALIVYESAIDALSHASLRLMVGEPWQDAHYLSLAGLSALPLQQSLGGHPEISAVRLCLDNDEAGRAAAERIYNLLRLSRPTLQISIEFPIVGKDYNQCLQSVRRDREHRKKHDGRQLQKPPCR